MEEIVRGLAAWEIASPGTFGIAAALTLLMLFLPALRRRRGLALNLRYWAPRVEFKSRRRLVLAMLAALASLLIAAGLAQPQVAVRPSVSIYGKPVIAVVDVSGSMGAKPRTYAGGMLNTDLRNGYEKARDVFLDLIGRRPDVNFALLMYSTESYIARYFTYKNELFQDTIENKKEVEYISTGTRTADALIKARTFLTDNVRGTDMAIVLISDLNGDLEAMVAMAEELERDTLAGIQVYVIVITTDDKSPAKPLKMEGVEMVEMNDKAGIDRMAQEISNMTPSPLRQEAAVEKKSLIPYVVLLALGFVMIVAVLTETRFRKLP
jgi:hypothetical protein